MQKHQWRQHGIVHFKQRPHPAGINTTGPPTTPLTKNTQIDGGGPASAVLYNSIVDRIKYNSLETMGESSRHLGGSPTEAMAPPPPPPPPPSHQMSQPQSPQSGPEDLSNPRSTLNSTDNEDDVSVPKPIGSTTDRSPPPAPSSRPTPAAEEEEEGEEEKEEEEEEEPAHDHNDEFKHAKHNFEARPTYEAADEASSSTFALSSSVARHLHSHRAAPLLDSTSPSSSSRSPSPQPQNHTRLLIALQPTPTSLPPLHPNEEEDDHRPIKLKKLLAHAYQKEVEEAEEQTRHQNQHSINTVTTTPHQQHLADENSSSSSEESCSGGSNKSSSAAPLGYNGEMQETVECQCKSCGHVFSVLDPYNFRCSSCNVKYTSLPTHMIADPLQCIGCCQVFPHKPALKSHQTRAAAGEGSCSERPFRCCKCGYGFRQKAHLQKHQWRIHRRKLEADPNVKEAEALLHVIKGGFSSSQAAPSAAAAVPKPPSLLDDGVATITLQDIIDRGVERSMRTVRQLPPPPSPPPQQPRPTSSSTNGSSQPLDLSPTKSINSNHHHHHHHPKLSDLVASMPRITVPPSISLLSNSLPLPRESNPLLNQLPLQLPTQPLRLNEAASSSSSPSGGWSKRQRTLLPSASSESDERHSSSNIIMHRSLPPITSLQRPPTETPSSYTKTSNWLAASTAMPPPPMTRHDDDNDMTSARRPADMVKKDLFIRDQLQGLRGRQHNDIRTV
jgi:predicted Zn-ribbon and HTH transcriptional regulator